MAKGKGKGDDNRKVTFGKRKGRRPSKTKNKHARKMSKYRGQGGRKY